MAKRRRRRRRNKTKRRLILGLLLLLIVAIVAAILAMPRIQVAWQLRTLKTAEVPAWVTQDYIPLGHARSGQPLEDYTGIVIHYVGNPGTSAANNRLYFAQDTTEVVSHFIVGLDGEIIQCVPLHERSAASNSRNRNTISIEVCHPDDSGKFNEATNRSLIRLTAWLCDLGDLDNDAVIRHYDVTGKECPRYHVSHPEAWQQFLRDVDAYRKEQ